MLLVIQDPTISGKMGGVSLSLGQRTTGVPSRGAVLIGYQSSIAGLSWVPKLAPLLSSPASAMPNALQQPVQCSFEPEVRLGGIWRNAACLSCLPHKHKGFRFAFALGGLRRQSHREGRRGPSAMPVSYGSSRSSPGLDRNGRIIRWLAGSRARDPRPLPPKPAMVVAPGRMVGLHQSRLGGERLVTVPSPASPSPRKSFLVRLPSAGIGERS
jgi:hypothetical protein